MTYEFEFRPRPNRRILLALLPILVACGGGNGTMGGASTSTCEPSAMLPCTCADGQVSFQRCAANGRGLGQCVCAVTLPTSNTPAAGAQAVSATGTGGLGSAASSGVPVTPPAANGGTTGLPSAGVSGAAPGFPQNPTPPPGNVPPASASGTGAPPPAGSGAPSTPAGNNAGAPTAGAAAGGDPMIEMARQVCIDTINMYRATKMLAPLMRVTAQETCSDAGAKKDGDSGIGHSSAFSCQGSYGQNSCPGYPVGGFGGATLSDALKMCLKGMWDEGEPPVSRTQCQMDTTGCFEKYGHYLNMTQNFKGVSCGFYHMKNGNWWMNQDFY